MATGQMPVQQWAASFSRGMDIAPMHDTHHHRIQVEPLLRQPVFMPDRPLAIRHFLQHARIDQLPQAVRQNVAFDAEPGLEMIEAPDTQEIITQDQQRSAISDDRNGPGYRTSFVGQFTPAHRSFSINCIWVLYRHSRVLAGKTCQLPTDPCNALL
jgi:hypothetical protein